MTDADNRRVSTSDAVAAKPARRLYQPAFAHSLEGIRLRLMQVEDEMVFRRLYAEVRAIELNQTGWSAEEKYYFCEAQYTLQDQHYRQHYADYEVWSICKGENVVGRLCLATFDQMLVLMDITIAAVERGKGIGMQILCDVVRQADQQKKKISLQVEPYNPAINLYERLGFIKAGDGDIYQEMQRTPAGN